MRPLSAHEIRERFLSFFESRGHRRMASDSLVPANDPTLLFTGAGMNQFKDMFLGKGSLPWKRVTTSQKCLRVPDLENVGLTPRHHTFFEMLGNFSFGDYFKAECIAWEWEFFSKVLEIPERQMVVTVYQDDDEAFAIWNGRVGLPREKIFRFGEKENFWPAEAPSKGPNGPCGPCSEIYFDARPDEPMPKHEGLTELPSDRFTEIGNCVFTQFDRQSDGSLVPLPQRNIDVGLGLERITAVLQRARNNFETDLFRPLLEDVARRSRRTYGADADADVRMRRISDHVRAVTFCIADGARPANEGRGYVVRKILRRAIRDGYELGIQDPFLHEMVDVVGSVMGDAYPEIREHARQCRSLIRSEEESFAQVYRQGMARLEEFLARGPAPSRGGQHMLPGSGAFAFQLHDTFGFPIDITKQVMKERGVVLDEAGFEQAMEEQRVRARASMATADTVFAANAAMLLRERGIAATQFVGYERLQSDSTVRALVTQQNEWLERASTGVQCQVVVDVTPFYAQGGGQVGDRGRIETPTGVMTITGTTSLDGYWLHHATVTEGTVEPGQRARLAVDEALRRATERNHTATHLLHAALKKVVGPHVSQAGSEVAPDRLRFDYTHGEKLTEAQIEAIEDIVNGVVLEARPATAVVRPIDDARREGFVALFGEKYGDQVRTLAVGEFSKELCGGTHVANTGSIGAFRIVLEQAISAGTRRLEAVTGLGALQLQRQERKSLQALAHGLKVPVAEVQTRVQALTDELKRVRKDLERATAADIGKLFADLRANVASGPSGKSYVARVDGVTQKELQDLLQRARKEFAPFVGVGLTPVDGEVAVVAVASPDLAATVPAGDLVKLVCGVLGGGGGGKGEMAQGKGRDATKLEAAITAVRDRLRSAGLTA